MTPQELEEKVAQATCYASTVRLSRGVSRVPTCCTQCLASGACLALPDDADRFDARAAIAVVMQAVIETIPKGPQTPASGYGEGLKEALDKCRTALLALLPAEMQP